MTIIKKSHFLKHNAVFFFGSVAVGGLNYLYYPILGRLMQPAAFGELQVLVSLFLQFTIFLNVLGMISVTILSNYRRSDKAHRVLFEIEKLSVYIALLMLVMSIIFGGWLQVQLRFESSIPFAALALALLVSIPLTFRSSYARAQKRFGIASMSQLIGAAAKMTFSAGLVVIGLGVTGAVFGIVVAQFVAFLYAARYAARIGFNRPADTNYKTKPDIKVVLPELRFAGVTFVSLLVVTLMMSIDVIAVKYFFDAHTAGLYAGIATVARIIFFLAAPIAQVLIPMVTIKESLKNNIKLLVKSLLLTVLICGSVLLACCMAPELIVKILMGPSYIAYADLLPSLALVVFIISIVNLVFMYYLALRQKMIMVIGIIGFGVLLSFLLMWHDTPRAIVQSMLLGSIFTLIATGIYVLVTLKRGLRDAKQNDFNRDSDL